MKDRIGFENIIGISHEMLRIYELISKVARSDSTVLISGKSGTGKELVARAIHSQSPRKDRPFIAINCASIPKDLLESELFGYEKGSFTGALSTKPGKFELANYGTIFLDEISNLCTETQAKILRVLQEKEIERVGGVKTIRIDVRIISATNIDLKNAVKEKRFREDLYYRLNVIPIDLPPLNKRKEDIPLLLDHFFKTCNERLNKEIEGITKEAMAYLMNYHWPGNVRELKNIVERLVVLKDRGSISHTDLPFEILKNDGQSVSLPPHQNLWCGGLRKAISEFEHKFILSALEKSDWDYIKASRLLRIRPNSLLSKLHTLKIKTPKNPTID